MYTRKSLVRLIYQGRTSLDLYKWQNQIPFNLAGNVNTGFYLLDSGRTVYHVPPTNLQTVFKTVNSNLSGNFSGSIWRGGKLFRIMLESGYLVHKYTHKRRLENIFFSTKVSLILVMPAFFCKKSALICKNGTFTQNNSVRAVLKIF